MKPQRMCMVCRERAEKELLLRIVKNKSGDIALDKEGKMPGRGAYICSKESCLRQAEKRKALERAFSCKVERSVYEELLSMCGGAEE